jgi:hypothetical protein
MQRISITLIATVALLWGCGENPSNSVQITAPAAAQNLIADKFSDGEVILGWTPSVGPDLLGYNIYRAQDNDSHYAKVAFVEGPHFRDTNLQYEQAYYYRVVALNTAGLESDPVRISGRPLNTLWPSQPRRVRVEARNLSKLGFRPEIELSWIANSEADLAAYRVYGSTQMNFTPDLSTLITEVQQPWLLLDAVEIGTSYYYKITAVDQGQLESEAASAEVELMPALLLEQPVSGIYANTKPTFVWQGIASVPNGANVRYTVSLTEGPASRELWVNETDGTQTRLQYSGPKLKEGTYWWKVLVEVTDKDDQAISLALSSLEHFRIR